MIGIDAEGLGIAGKAQQATSRNVGGDHLQAVTVVGVLGELGDTKVGEGPNAFGREQLLDPGMEALALVEALLEQNAEAASEEGNVVLPGLVLEGGEVEAREDLVKLGGAIAGGEERGDDRPCRGAGDVLGLEPALGEQIERADQPDALHAPSFEDQIDFFSFG